MSTILYIINAIVYEKTNLPLVKYLTLLRTILPFNRIIIYGVTYSAGVVYVVVLDVFGDESGITSWISTLITAVMFFTCKFGIGNKHARFNTARYANHPYIVTTTQGESEKQEKSI
jgi:uncharacterized membrane protein